MSTKMKRVRVVQRNHALPQYASLKNCNQINPLAWVAVSDHGQQKCAVYQIRQLLVESPEGKPLPLHMKVKMSTAKAFTNQLCKSYSGNERENIVRATVGKGEYIEWMERQRISWERSIYVTMLPEEINEISLLAYFKEHTQGETPQPIAHIKKGDTHFHHWQRGKQPIHTFIEFIQDYIPPPVDDDSDDEAFVIFDPTTTKPTLTLPTKKINQECLQSFPPKFQDTDFFFQNFLKFIERVPQ